MTTHIDPYPEEHARKILQQRHRSSERGESEEEEQTMGRAGVSDVCVVGEVCVIVPPCFFFGCMRVWEGGH
jgi:hypothetical protein